jgi:hypothetical protein
MQIYEFEYLKEDTTWTFSNGQSIELPKETNVVACVIYEELGVVALYPKKITPNAGEEGLGERHLNISILGELESKILKLPKARLAKPDS